MDTEQSQYELESDYKEDISPSSMAIPKKSGFKISSLNLVGSFNQSIPKPLTNRPFLLLLVVILILSVLVLTSTILSFIPPTPAKRLRNAAIATENQICSNIGADIMKEGGSAADAAIAACICIGTVNPFSSGIGGGGFLLAFDSESKDSLVIDFREEAPNNTSREVYVKNPTYAKLGGLSIGVPGELKGLEKLHQIHGKLEWKRLFESSIQLARNGFKASSLLVERLNEVEDMILKDPIWSAVFAPQGRLVKKGEIVKRIALADTLEAISESGSIVFYEGHIGEIIVSEIQEAGGVMTKQDLLTYEAKVRPAIHTYYHGRKILTCPPPASGAVLINVLNTLERFQLIEQKQDATNFHRIIEALKFGFSYRGLLGDPEFNENMTEIVNIITSKETAEMIRNNIDDLTTFESSHYSTQYGFIEDSGTTHLSVIDPNGLAISLTSTINMAWGSRIMSSTGVILNNQMDDFAIENSTNFYGLRPSPSNYILPKKRPVSSSTPTIVLEDTEVKVIVGASGGTRIITSTLQTILNLLDFGFDVYEAINFPRLHHQLYPEYLVLESNFPSRFSTPLKKLGHQITKLSNGVYQSAVQVISRGKDGFLYAASDSRKDGLPSGF